jgi:hypothetical protein
MIHPRDRALEGAQYATVDGNNRGCKIGNASQIMA